MRIKASAVSVETLPVQGLGRHLQSKDFAQKIKRLSFYRVWQKCFGLFSLLEDTILKIGGLFFSVTLATH